MLTRSFRSIFSLIEFPLGWIAVLGIALLDALWMSNTWLKLPSLWPVLVLLLSLFYTKGIYRLLVLAKILVSPRILIFFNRLLLLVEYAALCAAAASVTCILSYLVCSVNYPVVDRELNLIDQAIGFHWLQFFQLCHAQPTEKFLQFAYDSLIPQLAFFALWFSFLYRKDRLYEIFWLLFITLVVMVFVSTFLPATGPASILGLDSLYNSEIRNAFSDAALIRSKVSPDFSTHNMGGIVIFPSFHTACAIIFIYGFRKSGSVGHIILLLNIAMLCATPSFGDHYLIDLLVGAVITIISIIGIRRYYTHHVSDVALKVC